MTPYLILGGSRKSSEFGRYTPVPIMILVSIKLDGAITVPNAAGGHVSIADCPPYLDYIWSFHGVFKLKIAKLRFPDEYRQFSRRMCGEDLYAWLVFCQAGFNQWMAEHFLGVCAYSTFDENPSRRHIAGVFDGDICLELVDKSAVLTAPRVQSHGCANEPRSIAAHRFECGKNPSSRRDGSTSGNNDIGFCECISVCECDSQIVDKAAYSKTKVIKETVTNEVNNQNDGQDDCEEDRITHNEQSNKRIHRPDPPQLKTLTLSRLSVFRNEQVAA